MIELENVTIVRGSTKVLDNISLTIFEGQHVAILGPNGCGKSTLIRALTRELYPYGDEGKVRVCGLDRWVIRELRTLLGVISEEPTVHLLGDPTGLELAVSGLLGSYGIVAQSVITSEMWQDAREALEQVAASHLAERTIDTMSTGERRRCWIARALICRPRALVLDEPTNGLDLKAADGFHRTIGELARSGITIILVTHHLEEIVPEIDRVIMMKQGEVVADGPPELLLTIEKLADVFSISNPHLVDSIEGRLRLRNKACCM